MFCSISISNRELGASLYSSINDASNLLDSIFLRIINSLSLHVISREFFAQFSKHQRISVLHAICCRVVVENHIIAITYINRTIIMSSNITTDNIYTIIFQAAWCFDSSITDRTTTLVCVHIHFLCRLMSSYINLVLCIINHTLIASGRQLIIIDSLVKFIILPSQGFQFLITHGR